MPATHEQELSATLTMDHEDASVIVAQTLVDKKKDGYELEENDISFFVKGVVAEEIRQSQLGAMLMAIYVKGMSTDETVHLTNSFMHSGAILSWPDEWKCKVVDKHSTGGVGDKVSIPLAPALMACNLKVPMMAGRGLEHTGGTVDKLEAIPGFQTSQNTSSMQDLVHRIGGCIVSQTTQLNPADRIFYATRNVTSTVACNSLIVASIVSKKAVEGISCLVLDVKFGSAAFMKTKDDALKLANAMVDVGKGLGIKIAICLSRMEHPIGFKVGNALEIEESIHCLQGHGPDDLEDLTTAQGGVLLYLADMVESVEQGISRIRQVLKDGSALNKFREMMIAQGVLESDADELCNGDVWNVMKSANQVEDLPANYSGYVHHIDAMIIARICNDLGAGRKRLYQPVNHAVGIELKVQVGDSIQNGDIWVRIFHDFSSIEDKYITLMNSAIKIDEQPCKRPSRVEKIILPQ